MPGLIDNKPKHIIAREARTSLKLKTYPCGRSKKFLNIWLYLSKPKPRIPTFSYGRSQLRDRRKL
jgi:hypothetical protein